MNTQSAQWLLIEVLEVVNILIPHWIKTEKMYSKDFVNASDRS